ncbi:MAG: 5-oxopent-3-ene-1,2,5-tricarboxylate decarboxylase [Bordetella sp. SCN 67-23]|nr:fumarylacetoacetate hydrolase family protein [Burkholderiales bacterium]ODS73898.1 MAG: 5-oxopent-3-ene-1,2,5-tricarboxylate decarboxylase [Bordetella sp. SCN 67-23]ODU88345.1 MAG: 5-oxopent-3-ene-1,2,5-tricarboxylate decarboxylase [Bordetella sp. SCN 68-11]OJW94376.1 MAG: 5-oxopent-3-ene-1,2,5-tricarboxylate decarboxylase [Burkholderiales bacterium 67-32]
MRFVSFLRNGRAGYGVAKDDGIVELGGRLDAPDLRTLLARGMQDLAGALSARLAADFPLAEVQLMPVIPEPSKIICVGINYVAHAAEAGRTVGKHPVIFHRFADTLVGAGQPLLRPRVSDQFDYEGELAVVIGKGGRHIDPGDAMSHVAGYTIFNDASVRDWQFHTHQYGMGKNFAASGPLGPWMVTADEIADYRKLELRTYVNGEQVQEGRLDELAFDIPHLIAYVSQALPWNPGDILATGTPSGIGFKRTPPLLLKQGDSVRIEVTQIGELVNPVMDE